MKRVNSSFGPNAFSIPPGGGPICHFELRMPDCDLNELRSMTAFLRAQAKARRKTTKRRVQD